LYIHTCDVKKRLEEAELILTPDVVLA